MSVMGPGDRSRVARLPGRAAYDRETICAIIDEAPLCHVGFVDHGQPTVIPTLHGRLGDTLVIHGAQRSRLIERAASGEPVCLTFTLLDGLVLARSAFHHSVNYRSAVVFGAGWRVKEDEEKLAALEAITDRLMPGRWAEVRPPNPRELAATAVVAIRIEEASAKLRTGPPVDDPADLALPIWAGVAPLTTQFATPEPAEDLTPGTPLPRALRPR